MSVFGHRSSRYVHLLLHDAALLFHHLLCKKDQFACRDRSSRQVQDRQGDAATATNSNAGMRTRGSEETMATPADPDHVAKATALLEQFKAKNKPQSFELKVGG